MDRVADDTASVVQRKYRMNGQAALPYSHHQTQNQG